MHRTSREGQEPERKPDATTDDATLSIPEVKKRMTLSISEVKKRMLSAKMLSAKDAVGKEASQEASQEASPQEAAWEAAELAPWGSSGPAAPDNDGSQGDRERLQTPPH